MTLQFVNPVGLLPSGKEAIAKPPENDTLGFAIGATMKAVQEEVKARRDVQNLKAETNAMADYLQDKSPEISDMLRKKSDMYRPDPFNGYKGIDVSKEREGLLKGSIDLYRLEQGDRRLANSEKVLGIQNNYKAKLTAAEGLYNIAQRNYAKFESEERQAEANHERNRRQAAASSERDVIGPYTRRANPYESEVRASEEQVKSLLNATPADITGMGTPSQVMSGTSPASPSSPKLPSPYTPVVTAGDVDLPMSPAGEDSDSLLPMVSPPIVEEGAQPEAAATESPPVQLTEPVTTVVPETPARASLTPPTANDLAVNEILESNKRNREALMRVADRSIDNTMKQIEINTEDYEGKSQFDLNEAAKKAKADIAAVPNPASQLGIKEIDGIVQSFNSLASSTRKRSSAEGRGLKYDNLEPLPDFFLANNGKAEEINGVKVPVKVMRDKITGSLYVMAPDGTVTKADADLQSGKIVGPASAGTAQQSEPNASVKDILSL